MRQWFKFIIFSHPLGCGAEESRQVTGTDNRQKSAGFVDSKFTFQLLLILILSLLDAVLTLHLVPKGAWEANPMMRYALEIGPAFFITTKYFLTAAGFLFLIRNGRLLVFGGRFSLEEIANGLILFYIGLVIYEVKIFQIVFRAV